MTVLQPAEHPVLWPGGEPAGRAPFATAVVQALCEFATALTLYILPGQRPEQDSNLRPTA